MWKGIIHLWSEALVHMATTNLFKKENHIFGVSRESEKNIMCSQLFIP
jgi:hypothetical protein